MATHIRMWEFSEPWVVHICISTGSKFLSSSKSCPFSPGHTACSFQPSHLSAFWAAWVQLKCNAKQINRLAVRPSLETILALSVHTESRMEVTQIKCNGIKYIAECTVTRNYWWTIFLSPYNISISFLYDFYIVLIKYLHQCQTHNRHTTNAFFINKIKWINYLNQIQWID